ncbi:MAG: DUF5979 domain-containing protein [Pseudolabrys sp.]|nr:DUF5979 domain-containing protein [Pseudolabrys sp.]
MRSAQVALAALLTLGVFLADARASGNLIQNPGFESAPPANLGNNIGHSIAPWIVGTGNSPNVVKVDGPGGYNYGNLGPESDASAPGAGVKQHYLDIANGANDFYQSFKVPACQAAPEGTQATVKFGGYFSGRGNAGGSATVTLRQGTGLSGTVIQTATGVVPSGASKTDPWIHVQGTATLVFGSTFSYVVKMPNEINFDNAHLTIESDPCDPPPPPSSSGCLSLTPDVKCGTNGTFTITLNGSNFAGNEITLAAQTPGVTISPPQQAWAASTTWTVSGATPGQALTLIANATKTGGGSEAGTDQCCSAELKITAPECPPPLDVKLEKKLTGKMGPHFMFDIDVSNVGTAFVNGAFTVTDAVPSGMTVMSATGGWTCNTPVTGPNPLLCTLPVASIPLNGTLPTIKLTTMTTGPGPWENCAVVSVVTTSGTDTNPANDKGCATVAVEQVGELIIEKKVVYTGELMMPALTYPVTVTCGSWSQTFNLTPNVPQSTGGVPLNVNCSVVETLPPAPASACPAPKVATWQTPPVIAPATPFQLSGVSTSVTVTNTLDCKSEPPGTVTFTVNKEVINRTVPQIPVTGIVFPISTSCQSGSSPAVVTPMPLLDGGSQTISGITSGTTCTVAEAPPPPPTIIAISCSTPGHVPVWSTVLPAPVTLGNTNATATVQNFLDCKPDSGGQLGELVLTKVVNNPYKAFLTTDNLVYPTSVSCATGGSPAVVTNVGLSEAGPQTVSNIALNSQCTITETPPTVTGLCPTPGAVPTWATPSMNPASPVAVNGTTVNVTVTNTLECKPAGGYLLVQKLIDRPNSVPLSALNALTFPVVVTCDGNAAPLNVPFGTSAVLSNIPHNQVCTVVETLPPPPNVPNVCPAGQSLAWTLPPTYTPASATITPGPGKTIVVRNTLDCAPSTNQTGSLTVSKTVVNNIGGTVAGLAFPANLSCSSGMSPAVVTPLTLSHGSTQTIGNIALGSTCTVSETPPAPPGACADQTKVPTWTTTYTPLTASIPTDTSIAVVNTLDCKASGGGGGSMGGGLTSQLILQKVVVSQRPATPPTTQTFPVTATCGGNAVTRNMLHNTNQPVGQVPYGACTISEPTPPVLAGSCPKGWTGAWTSIYQTTVAINQPTHVVNVTNTLTCTEDGGKGGPPPKVTQTVCKPPMVASAIPGQCACPAGTTKRGERCVPTVVCRSPAKLNRSGTGCDCPDGYAKRGNTCVKDERRGPAITPNDVIRVVPGLIGPGGFGGGGGGGRSGGDRGGSGGGSPAGVR